MPSGDRTVLAAPGWARAGLLGVAVPPLIAAFASEGTDRVVVLLGWVVLLAILGVTLGRGGTQVLPSGVRPWGWLVRVVPWSDVTAVCRTGRPARRGELGLQVRGRRQLLALPWSTLGDLPLLQRRLAEQAGLEGRSRG